MDPNERLRNQTIQCLFCHGTILFTGLPAERYHEHLNTEHSIWFDLEFIVDRTLFKDKHAKKVHVDSSCQTEAITDPTSSSSPSCLPTTFEGCQRAWFDGCEFDCRLCGVSHFNEEGLLGHLNQSHLNITSIEDYLKNCNTFRTKENLIKCVSCQVQIPHQKQTILHHMWYKHKSKNLEMAKHLFETESISKAVNIHCPKQPALSKPGEVQTSSTPMIILGAKRSFQEMPPSKRSRVSDHQAPIQGSSEVQSATVLQKKKPLAASKGPKPPPRDWNSDITSDTPPLESTNKENQQTYLGNMRAKEKDLSNVQSNPVRPSVKKAWYEGSEFQCQLCQEVFYERIGLLNHFKLHHNIDSATYTGQFKTLETKMKYFTCQECNLKMRHYKTSIEGHLELHNMSLDAYAEKYKLVKSKEAPAVQATPVQTSSASSSEERLAPANTEDKGSTVTFSSFQAFEKGACELQCRLCQFQTFSADDLGIHFTTKHGTQMDMNTLSSSFIKTQLLKCLLCGEGIYHEPLSVRCHAEENHSMNVRNFLRQHYKPIVACRPERHEDAAPLQKLKTDFPCPICGKKFNKLGGLQFHTRIEHDDEDANEPESQEVIDLVSSSDNEAQRSSSETAEAPSTAPEQPATTKLVLDKENNLMTRKEEEKKKKKPSDYAIKKKKNRRDAFLWSRAKEFECTICQIIYPSKDLTLHHLREVHQKTNSSLCAAKPFILDCAICHEQVRRSPVHLNQHMKTHRLKTTSYWMMFVKDQDERGMTLYKWQNQCLFSCQLCQKGFITFTFLAMHLAIEHLMDSSEYAKRFDTNPSKIQRHSCLHPDCGEQVVQEATALNLHITRKHKMSLSNYYLDYVHGKPIPGQDQQTASGSSIKLELRQEDMVAIPFPHSDKDEDNSDEVNQEPLDLHLSEEEESALTVGSKKRKIDWNRCIYQCPDCHHCAKAYSTIINHCKIKHNKGVSNVPRRNVYHTCLVCGKGIKCERTSLSKHLAGHNLKFEEYEADNEEQLLEEERQWREEMARELQLPHPSELATARATNECLEDRLDRVNHSLVTALETVSNQ